MVNVLLQRAGVVAGTAKNRRHEAKSLASASRNTLARAGGLSSVSYKSSIATAFGSTLTVSTSGTIVFGTDFLAIGSDNRSNLVLKTTIPIPRLFSRNKDSFGTQITINKQLWEGPIEALKYANSHPKYIFGPPVTPNNLLLRLIIKK